MKLTTAETNALTLYLDDLHEDDLESIVGQFRRLAVSVREKRLRGESVHMLNPCDYEWYEWRKDLTDAGAIVARIRNPAITDEAAQLYAVVCANATEVTRTLYLLNDDGRSPALDQLDALEAECETDPAAAW